MGFSRIPTELPETVLGPHEEGRVGDLKVGGRFVSSKDGCQGQAGVFWGRGQSGSGRVWVLLQTQLCAGGGGVRCEHACVITVAR